MDRRRLAFVSAATMAIVVLVECSGPSGANRSGVERGGRAAPGGATPSCRASRLRLISDVGGWHGNYSASNQFRESFVFTNISHSKCKLQGWPGVKAVVGGAPRKTAETRVRQNAPPAAPWSAVVLHPAGTAAFDVYGQDYDFVNNRACPQTSGFSSPRPTNHHRSPLWRSFRTADRRSTWRR